MQQGIPIAMICLLVSYPLAREIYIDHSDFSEDTTLSRKKFKRLVIGDYVRLRGAYVIRADQVIRDSHDQIIEIVGSYVPDTVGENPARGYSSTWCYSLGVGD